MMHRLWTALRQRSGSVMISAVLASAVIASLTVVMLNRATAHTRQMQHSTELDQSWYLAMAGIEECLARLRWDGTTWNTLANTAQNCGPGQPVQLGAGTYTVTARLVDNPNPALATLVRMEATGRYNRFDRRVVAFAQWQLSTSGTTGTTGTPGSTGSTGSTFTPSFGAITMFGGGDWHFDGFAKVSGNIATKGNMTFGGNNEICGEAHAWGTVAANPANQDIEDHFTPGCPSAAVSNSTAVVDYSDDLSTVGIRLAGPPPNNRPLGEYTLNCVTDCGSLDESFSVDGIAVVPNSGLHFTKSVKIVAKGFIVDGNITTDPGVIVKLYSESAYGGGTNNTCPSTNATQTGNDVGTSLTMYIAQRELHDVVIWAPNGGVYLRGSQAGGQAAGIYGMIVTKCTRLSGNWNFSPGTSTPPSGGAGGTTSGGGTGSGSTSSSSGLSLIKSLLLTSIYET